MPDPHPAERARGRVVGVDLGIKSLAVLSTGEIVPNPRHLDDALVALRRTQRKVSRRRGPDRRTRQVQSNRWRKAKLRVSALHTRVGNARRDGLHKLTTRLVRDHDTIVIEDLNVAGMVHNRRLARAISGLGMAEFRRQVEYKAAAMNLARLTDEVTSEASCARTKMSPLETHVRPPWAATGTATGRLHSGVNVAPARWRLHETS